MEIITDSHEWVRRDGDIATVGITKKACAEIGEIVHIELPKVGQVVQKGDEVVILESTKAAIDSYAPLSGVITEVNDQLIATPGLVNTDPEVSGWIYRIRNLG